MTMRELLSRKFFPFVIRPGRYSGGEPGTIVKEPTGRTAYLHAFPDKYELGQSYLGLQTIYQVVNADDRFLCERAFAVDHDAEELMRRENIPLFSLESSRSAAEFDAVGFTLPYELISTNLLTMIDLAGIPVRSADRSDQHPLILAGGPGAFNPEPLSPFVDLFFIGDAEEGLLEMLGIIHEMKGASRLEKLERLVREVESVYVSRFYDDEHQPTESFAPAEIKARVIRELKPEFYPEHPIVPLIETAHQHMGVEIMRGCPQGCRFCQAGPIYRPVRVRPQSDILNQIDRQLANSGHHEVALVSLSTSDYPYIEPLAKTLARRLKDRRISVGLPSLRPGSISPSLLRAVSTVRKSGLTIAPEAGTERLRLFIRKDFPDQAIYDTVRMAYDAGWTTIKLYFMVGLPTETDDDLVGIARIIENCWDLGRGKSGRKTINVTLSPFMPKPHTPFQWDGIGSLEETLRKIKLIRRTCRARGVNFKHHSVEMSILAGMLGRGGREMGEVIEEVFRKGARFDGWSESFRPELWFDTLEEKGMVLADLLKPVPFDRPLPWAHIRKGVSIEHLKKERQRTSAQLSEYVPPPDTDDGQPEQPSMSFGRSKKKVATRQTSSAPTKNRLRIRWGKTDRLRYMSHLDNMRLIERLLRRAHLPVAYSQGFNPAMKLSFGPPLPLGYTSEAEFVEITMEDNLRPQMVDSLTEMAPDGLTILDSRSIYDKSASLSARLNRVTYTIPAMALGETAAVEDRAANLLAAESLVVDRQSKKEVKQIDIRPAVFDLEVAGDELVMVLGLGDAGYARPTEVAMLMFDELTVEALGFHRRDLYRQESDSRIIPGMDV